jgi:hypothetical protein
MKRMLFGALAVAGATAALAAPSSAMADTAVPTCFTGEPLNECGDRLINETIGTAVYHLRYYERLLDPGSDPIPDVEQACEILFPTCPTA